MPDRRGSAINWFNENQTNHVNNLKEWLKIPSISTDSSHKSDLEKAATWIAAYLNKIGIQSTRIFPTKHNPIVFGEYESAGENKPTVLVYGHYDVQPPDPLDQWHSDPFSPIEKNGKLYARGASDMKGQIMVSLSAIDSIMQTGDLPINLKFLIEGEEEIGSPSIELFLKDHRELLASDFALNLDAGMIAADTPNIVYGLRGLAYFEILINGPEHDLHSGLFGGIVYNPTQALCEVLAKMKDVNGRIQLPGFYDDVRPISTEERKELSRLPMDDQYYLDQTGVKKLWGEKGFSSVERVGARPTLEIHGIKSGYIGEGPKTVIPSFAMAKLSTRLVPDQNPDRVHEQLLSFLKLTVPEYVRCDLKRITSDFPCIIDRDFVPTQSFSKALEEEWHKKAVFKREGGSIPIVSHMKTILGIETVLSGFGLPEDRIHSPNEHINLQVWKKGVETVIHFFFNLAGINA